jgi:hypothetical protein
MSHTRRDHYKDHKSEKKHHHKDHIHHHAHNSNTLFQPPSREHAEPAQEVNVNVTIEQGGGEDCFTTCMGGLGTCMGKAAGNAI